MTTRSLFSRCCCAKYCKVWHPFEELFLATAAIFIFELFAARIYFLFILSSHALNFRNPFGSAYNKSIELFPPSVSSPITLTFTGLCLWKSSWRIGFFFPWTRATVFREISARSTDLQNLLGSPRWCETHLCGAAGWEDSALLGR